METSDKRLHSNILMKVVATVLGSLFSVFVFAQETKKIDVDINTNGDGFFGSPWIWVVGVAVFILLLVALLRGSGRRGDA